MGRPDSLSTWYIAHPHAHHRQSAKEWGTSEENITNQKIEKTCFKMDYLGHISIKIFKNAKYTLESNLLQFPLTPDLINVEVDILGFSSSNGGAPSFRINKITLLVFTTS